VLVPALPEPTVAAVVPAVLAAVAVLPAPPAAALATLPPVPAGLVPVPAVAAPGPAGLPAVAVAPVVPALAAGPPAIVPVAAGIIAPVPPGSVWDWPQAPKDSAALATRMRDLGIEELRM
jgi:hypothetical protein